jgi:hypothetical protein
MNGFKMRGTSALCAAPRRLAILGLVMAMLPGCNYVQLRRNTTQQSRTISDVHYQQVLDNLAMFRSDPQAMPFFSLIDTGTISADTTAAATGGLAWNARTLTGETLSLNGTRHWNGNWKLDPVNDGQALDAMRFVYQVAVGYRDLGDKTGGCCGLLTTKFRVDCSECEIPSPGWYECGNKHMVPKNVCYVGHYCDSYVWVMPGYEDYLSRLLITTLKIAFYAPGVPGPPAAYRAAPATILKGDDLDQLDKSPLNEDVKTRLKKRLLEDLSDERNQMIQRIEVVPAPARTNPTPSMAPSFGSGS